MSQQVIIFDTTLRDGEQALQASLNVKEKNADSSGARAHGR